MTTLRQHLRELAQTSVRFGYRLLVMMRRESWEVGKHRVYRLYTEESLALRGKRPWRHATAVHREHAGKRSPATRFGGRQAEDRRVRASALGNTLSE